MGLTPTKECVNCGAQQPRGWTEVKTFTCDTCKSKAAAEAKGYRTLVAPRSMANKSHAAREAAKMENALRSDPTRRALHRSGDDLDPLNPGSLTSPLHPAYHVNDRNDWDSSSHRNHSSSSDDDSRHSSHSSWSGDSGSSDSSSDSGSSSSGSSD